jgi:NCAIR mutase (PurE)-related protein
MRENGSTVMAARANKEVYQAIKNALPEVRYFEKAKIAVLGERKEKVSSQTILVVSGGTADIPVAEEAGVTAEIMNNKVDRLYDVGVAGIHRLFDNKDKLFSANVLVVVAGMEGALPSVVGGLVSKPVIAVPTSVGYGASFKGVSALLTMLNSCAPGIAVVNIDNGFGAGYMASLINQIGREK